MSGIVALVSRNGRPVEPRAAGAMLDAMAYRGPDGAAAAGVGRAVLGCAKLVVTAEDETDLQPRVSAATGCAIVADVRLDNRADLLATPPRAAAGDGERRGADPARLRGLGSGRPPAPAAATSPS